MDIVLHFGHILSSFYIIILFFELSIHSHIHSSFFLSLFHFFPVDHCGYTISYFLFPFSTSFLYPSISLHPELASGAGGWNQESAYSTPRA